MTEQDEKNKIQYFILFRIILTTAVFIVGGLVLNIKFVKPSIDPFYLLVGILYIINIPWIIILKKNLLKPRLHSAFQLYMDLFIQIAIIHYSGGLNSNSPFVYLPLISIIASAFMVSSRMVVAYSISAAFLYVFVSLIEFYGWLPSFLAGKTTMDINPIDYLYYRIYMHLIIFVGIGYLVSVLNTRIRFQLDEVAKYKHLSDIILYQIKSGLITISNSEKIIYSNQAASEILGYTREELLGRDWQHVLVSAGNPIPLDIMQQASSSRGAEIDAETKSGAIRIIGFNLTALKNDSGEVIGKTMVFRDITDIKNMEEKLKEKKRLEAIGELASIMAHELKNPLAAICGSMEVLRESKDFTTKKGEQLINIIFKESERLSRTLAEVLAFTGDTALKKEKREILHILEEVLSLIQNSPDFKKNIQIEKNYDATTFYSAFLDESSIKQVFFNLILNAAQAMPDGGLLSLTAEPFRKDDLNFLKVIIKDTGKGFSANIKDRLFDPFFTTKEKGIGLGLTVVKKIIEKHGWEIELISNHGKGCEAVLTLPISR